MSEFVPYDESTADSKLAEEIENKLAEFDRIESELDGVPLKDLMNRFRRVGEKYEYKTSDGKWAELTNSYPAENKDVKCYTTGVELTGFSCNNFINSLLKSSVTEEQLNNVGAVTHEHVQNTHPKLAIKLLKDLGFKRTKSSTSGLWYIQSVEKVLNKPGTVLSMMTGLNENAKNYLNLLVQLVNSNAIYNPEPAETPVSMDEMTKAEGDVPEEVKRMGIRRHVPFNKRSLTSINWESLHRSPVNRFYRPSPGTYMDVGLAFGAAPRVSAFGMTPTFGMMTLSGGGKMKGQFTNSISSLVEKYVNKLKAKGHLSDDEATKIENRLKEMDDVEVELFNTLRTYQKYESLLNSVGDRLPAGQKTKEVMESILARWEPLLNRYNKHSLAAMELISAFQETFGGEHDL